MGSLLPKTVYYFKVRAESAAGSSPDSELSDPIETLLPISEPGKPTATRVTHNSITLKWDKPKQGAETVERYTIFYQCSADDSVDSSWCTHNTPNALETAELSGLVPQTKYVFKVRAESTAGSSQDSKISDCFETLLPLSQPGKPSYSKVTHNSITLKWDKPKQGAETVEHYIIVYRCSVDDTGLVWKTFKTSNRKVTTTVFNLDSKMFYIFKVKAESATAISPESDSSDPIETQSPISQPGKPNLVKVTHNSITLQWSKSDRAVSAIQYYTILYQRCLIDDRDHWTVFKTSNTQPNATLSNLDPKTAYVFKLRAECAV